MNADERRPNSVIPDDDPCELITWTIITTKDGRSESYRGSVEDFQDNAPPGFLRVTRRQYLALDQIVSMEERQTVLTTREDALGKHEQVHG